MSTPIGSWTPRTFLSRFTEPEKVAVFAAAASQAAVMRLMFEFCMSERIRSDHPELEPGMEALVSAGILTPERKAVILDPLT